MENSEEFARMEAALDRSLARHHVANAALREATPHHAATMQGQVAVKWQWYTSQPEVIAARDAYADVRAKLEAIFFTPPITDADRMQVREAIVLYETEFGDTLRLARGHFWPDITNAA